MASLTLVMLSVSLIFNRVSSQPISQNQKLVPSTESTPDVNQSDEPVMFNLDTFLDFSEDTDQVKSLHGVLFDPDLTRTKRNTIKTNHACPENMVWVYTECVWNNEYDDAKGDEYVDS